MFAGIGNKWYNIKCYLFWYFKSDSSVAGETINMFETEKKCVKSEYKITKLITHIYAVNLLEHSSR